MIAVDALEVRAGAFTLREVSFAVAAGDYGVVLGPAGAGKTTLLETIAGVMPARGGRVLLRGVDVTCQAPERRKVGMVYQQAYLFPHLDVLANMAYGAASRDDALALARRFGAETLVERDARTLSGGERQLVALVRALAPRPDVLLLDEPWSALDPRRRAHVRRALRDLHAERGITVLQVSHDFVEVGLLGDVAVLLNEGRMLQAARPDTLFRHPASPAVAEFLGAENVLPGMVRTMRLRADAGGAAGAECVGTRHVEFRSGALVLEACTDLPDGPAHAVVRGEEVVLSRVPPGAGTRNRFSGRVVELAAQGPLLRVTILAAGTPVVATIAARSAEELALAVDVEVHGAFEALAVHIC